MQHTVPIEKGTETIDMTMYWSGKRMQHRPLEKGLKPSNQAGTLSGAVLMQHRPHREGD